MNHRERTRKERYDDKKRTAKTYPIGLCCVNFKYDGNFAYLIRAAACFGADAIHVIGSIPPRSALNALSGSLYDYVEIKKYSSPMDFLNYTRDNQIKLVAAEICEGAEPITSYRFNFRSPTIMVVGHEELGTPVEILKNSDKVYVPMPGVGYCLNTSQTANIMLYEATKQFEYHKKVESSWDEWECYHLP
jgi:tRNA G18 (ribose-2'-O)-methylase SpoU